MKFHLILTLDYELFGNGSGCLKNCVVRPTDACLTTLEKFGAKLAFFTDATEFAALNRYPEHFAEGMAAVEQQLVNAVAQGHSLQLHLHPQWMQARYRDGVWDLQLDKWRIGDLSEAEIAHCVEEGLSYLRGLVARAETDSTENCKVFRAGGWAIQPAEKVLAVLAAQGIEMETTVAPGAYNPSNGDWYDFRRSPLKPFWKISTELLQPDESGLQPALMEVPITTAKVGRLLHARALKEHKTSPAFPAGCSGTYDGPNSRLQNLRGKLSKLARMGCVMLDFSTMPGWMLVEITRRYQALYAGEKHPVPLVAIGHNKNYTETSNRHLQFWLDWVAQQNDIQFSTYASWLAAYRNSPAC